MEHVVIHDPDNGIPDETHVWRNPGLASVCVTRHGISMEMPVTGKLMWVSVDEMMTAHALAFGIRGRNVIRLAYRKHLELRDG